MREWESLLLSDHGLAFDCLGWFIQYQATGQRLRNRLGIGSLGWRKVAYGIARRIRADLRAAGKIEYLGRSLGWRVKR